MHVSRIPAVALACVAVLLLPATATGASNSTAPGVAATIPSSFSARPAAPPPFGEAPEPTVDVLRLTGVVPALVDELPENPPAPADDPAPAPEEAPAPDVLTRELSTDTFSVLGFSWDDTPDLADVVVRYRVQIAGQWSAWEAIGRSEIEPDAGTRDADAGADRAQTDAIVAVGAGGLQVWAQAGTGTVTGLRVTLIDTGDVSEPAAVDASDAAPAPGETGGATSPPTTVPTDPAPSAEPTTDPTNEPAPSDEVVTPASFRESGLRSSGALQSTTAAPTAPAASRPAIITRAQWGAPAPVCQPDYSPSMVTAAVHHTASANGYTADQVPGILRGFYTYHTTPEAQGGRGWCDIGYNFLVDRFGRIFEGRAGSIDSTVVGVHTGGFNSRTVGVAAIGDFSSSAPAEVLEGVSQVIAWKFQDLRIAANTTVQLVSGGGASKYPEGTVVTFSTVYGHRDAQQTACPGQSLYDSLPAIRTRVAALTAGTWSWSPFGSWERAETTTTTLTVTGWIHDTDSRSPIELELVIDGQARRVTADGVRPDVQAAFATAGPRTGFTVTVDLPRGEAVACLRAINVGAGVDVLMGCRLVRADIDPRGHMDSVAVTGTTVHVSGWAFDPSSTDPIYVWITVDGAGHHVRADAPRPDVDEAYPAAGPLTGFVDAFQVGPGSHGICATASNVGPGDHTFLGCSTVTVSARSDPLGHLDTVSAAGGTVTISGWAFDPDSSGPAFVWITVDGVGHHVATTQARADVAAAYPDAGSSRGFVDVLTLGPGSHGVCATVSNTGPGSHQFLGCRSITVDPNPVGQFESLVATGRALTITGWAFDPDSPGGVYLWVTLDGGGHHIWSSGLRDDVRRVYAAAVNPGYVDRIATTPGLHNVCVTAVNAGAGRHTFLGCRAAFVS